MICAFYYPNDLLPTDLLHLRQGTHSKEVDMELLERLFRPEVMGMTMIIVICISAACSTIAATYFKHRERMASIEQGMDPDQREP